MKIYKKDAPTERRILAAMRESNMPWTGGMISGFANNNPKLVYSMKCAGRLVKIERNLYCVAA